MPIPDDPNNYIHKGIPLRVGATRCILGTIRSEDNPPTDASTDYTNITGCSPRDPEHHIVTDAIDDKATSLACWQSYPQKLTSSTEDVDTHLVIKARGQLLIAANGDWYLPRIKLSLRPLYSELDYRFPRDFTLAPSVNPVTHFGQPGDLTTYSENSDGEMVINDFPANYNYASDPSLQIPGLRSVEPSAGLTQSQVDSNARHDLAINEAYNHFSDHSNKIRFSGRFYWRSKDKPSSLPAKFAPPLEPHEIDLTLFPHADTEEDYILGINESYDFRYRFPYWWTTAGGVPSRSFFPNIWKWTAPTIDNTTPNPYYADPLNPFLAPILVPVQKYARVREPSDFPIPQATPGDEQELYHQGVRNLHGQTLVESVTKIRKRYPFSFSTKVLWTPTRQSVYIPDWSPNASFEYWSFGGVDEGNIPEKLWRHFTGFFGGEQGDEGYEEVEKYDCKSYWRLEIELDREEWNYSEEEEKGWKIAVKINFSQRLQGSFTADNTIAQKGQVFKGDGQPSPDPFASNCIYKTAAFPDNSPATTAGSVTIEVKVTKKNAVGKPVKVLDFPIGGTAVYDGVSLQFGTAPNSTMTYIRDFSIVSIVPYWDY